MLKKPMLLLLGLFSINQTEASAKYQAKFEEKINLVEYVIDYAKHEERQIFKVLGLKKEVKVKQVLNAFYAIDRIEKIIKELNKKMLTLRELNEKQINIEKEEYFKNKIVENNKTLFSLEKKILSLVQNNKNLKLYIKQSECFREIYKFYKKEVKLNSTIKTFLYSILGFLVAGLVLTGLVIVGIALCFPLIIAAGISPIVNTIYATTTVAILGYQILYIIVPYYFGIKALILFIGRVQLRIDKSATFISSKNTKDNNFLITQDSIILLDNSVSSFFYRIREFFKGLFS